MDQENESSVEEMLSSVEEGLASEIGEVEGKIDIPEDASEEPAEPSGSEEPGEPKEPEQEAVESNASPPSRPAPDTWKPEVAEKFASLPPEVQDEIFRREDDIRQGLAQAKDHTAVASGVEKLLLPYAQIMNDYGVNPWDHMANLLNAHATLMFGRPEQKTALINTLIEQAGLDRKGLADGVAAPYNVNEQRLMSEVTSLRQQLTGISNYVSEERLNQLEAEITAFAAKPENVYFWDIAPEIQRLLVANPKMTLAQAYNDAIYDNPIVREKEIDRLHRERIEKAAKESKGRADAARKASAVNVKSGGERKTPAGSGNWEDDLASMLSTIRARE